MDIDGDCSIPIRVLASNQSVNDLTVYGMPFWAVILVICILLLVSGLFSASENAFSNCDKYHFKARAEKGSLTSKLVVRLSEQFESTLVSVLVGNNIVQTLMSSISAIFFYNLCNVYGLGDSVEVILSTVVMAFLVYIVSDTVPKILSKAMPNRMAFFLAWPDFIISILLYPVIFIFKWILKAVHKLFKIEEDDLLKKEDLIAKADEAILENELTKEEEELLEPDEVHLLKQALSMNEKTIKDVYTPLDKVVAIEEGELSVKEVNDFLLACKYSRIPVYRDEKENFIGFLAINKYFGEYFKDHHLDPRSTLLPVLEISSNEKLLDAFDEFSDEQVHIAMVTEEGKNIGIVTLDDILDELFNVPSGEGGL